MADGKVIIETALDNSGIKTGLSKLNSLTVKGLKVTTGAITGAITGTATALGGVATAAIKVGSDFEAQMSRVQAISGATGEDFQKLKDQAIQLGADTAFSASSAAEGMENLAAAGFTTTEIMDAMPGLLDLAAASGEDLASSSDIAASTLRGFGLAASEAGHVADVLAENANRTNSSVAETGEAMKYIAPLARASGISMEETAAAIGIMANAGIQGSQAGTTLRGALSRLSKPTKNMIEAMDELGISFYDSNGKMKSLSEQVGMLRQATEGMTDEQKNNYLVTLYGQEALSGMLALINEGEGSLSELTKSYETCDGSAKAAADTMQDNLAGAIEQLGGSAETFGIVFYESVSGSLKDTVETVTDSVNAITDAFKEGGIEEAVKTAGNEFADLAVMAAEHAPDMVDTAVDFIESFMKGISENKNKLLGAAGEIAETLAKGLTKLLPKKLREPAEKAIEAITDAFEEGGIEGAIEAAGNEFANLAVIAAEYAPDMVDTAAEFIDAFIDGTSDNADELLEAAGVIAEALAKGLVKLLPKELQEPVEKAIEAISKSLTGGGLKKGIETTVHTFENLFDIVEEITETALPLFTDALDFAGDHLGELARLVGGISAAIFIYKGYVKTAATAQKIYNVAMDAYRVYVKKAAAETAILNTVTSANPIGLIAAVVGGAIGGLALYNLTLEDTISDSEAFNQKLTEEVEALEDAKKARQESVEGIESEYGYYQELWDELQGIVDQNGKIQKGYEERAAFITGTLSEATGEEIEIIDGVIQNYDKLKDSISQVIEKKREEALISAYEDAYTEAVKKREDAIDDVTKAYSYWQDAIKKASDAENNFKNAAKDGIEGLEEYSREMATANDEVKLAKDSYEKATEKLGVYNSTISNYEWAVGAVQSGSQDAALAVQALSGELQTANSSTSEALKKQVDTFYAKYAEIKNAASSGAQGVNDEIVGKAQALCYLAQAEYAKAAGASQEEIDSWMNRARTAISSSGMPEAAQQEVQETANKMTETAEATKEQTAQAGKTQKDSYDSGVKSGDNSAGTEVVSKTASDIAQETENQKGNVEASGDSLGNAYSTSVSNSDVSSSVKKFTDDIIYTLKSADLAKTGAAEGKSFAEGVKNGINSSRAVTVSAAKMLGQKACEALESQNLQQKGTKEGLNFGNGLAKGIGEKNSLVKGAGHSLGNQAVRGLESRDIYGEAYNDGLNFSYGLANGIYAGESEAISAAVSVAAASLQAAQNELDINSPSRKTRSFGLSFDEGLVVGMENGQKEVEKTTTELSSRMLSAFNMQGITERMRAIMGMNIERATRGIRSETILTRNIFPSLNTPEKEGEEIPVQLVNVFEVDGKEMERKTVKAVIKKVSSTQYAVRRSKGGNG